MSGFICSHSMVQAIQINVKTTFPISTLALVPIFRIAPAELIPCEEESFFIKRWQKTKIVLCFPMTIMDLLEQKYCISWPISWIIAATHTYKSTKSCKDNHSECKNLVTLPTHIHWNFFTPVAKYFQPLNFPLIHSFFMSGTSCYSIQCICSNIK